MLSYDEALARILGSVPGPLPFEQIPVTEALHRALAGDITASIDLPPFDNSAVDGYALNGAGLASTTVLLTLPQAFEIAAGVAPDQSLAPGFVARIYTGAPLPAGADRVVMQEDTQTDPGGAITLLDLGRPGDFIRKAGSDAPNGATVLTAGQTISPGALGMLCSLGLTTITVPRRPRVAILSTGDELIPAGSAPLQPGQIYDSNGPALAAAVVEAGGQVVLRRHTQDSIADTHAAFDACQDCDLIVTSGGVSVGDRDYIKAVAEERGRLDFWRVAIRPGKPLAYGTIGDSRFFGLPGNPVSSLVTFELFVRPLLRKLAGHSSYLRPMVMATLTEPVPHEPGRREFVRAMVAWRDDRCFATPTGRQGSHRLSSLLTANALLIADENHGDYPPGATLPALLLSLA